MKVVSTAVKDADYYRILLGVGRNASFKQEIFDLRAQKLNSLTRITANDENIAENVMYIIGQVASLDEIINNVILRADEDDQLRKVSKLKES